MIRALILLLCANLAFAGEDIVQKSNNESTSTNKFDSLGIGGSDYDIGNNVCRYHTGGLTFSFAPRDKVCEGINLIRIGAVEMGVRHLCTQSPIRDNYPSFEECQADARQLSKAMQDEPGISHDEEQEYHEQQEQRYEEVLIQLEELKQQEPRIVYRTDPELQRQLKADEERRQKAREALQGDRK